MKITVQFESLAEFQEHMMRPAAIKFNPDSIEIEPMPVEKQRDPASVEEEPEPAPAPAPAEPDPEPVQITEDFRAEVRRAMATLNKQTGENTAKKLLQERGFASLKVAPLEALPELMETVRGMVK